MIPGLDEFVTAFKNVTNGHIDLYENNSTSLKKWTSKNFDVKPIVLEMDAADREILLSVVKRAYDLVRTHHRVYSVYLLRREDYYREASIDRAKDNRIMDAVANNLNKMYDDIMTIKDQEEV